MVFTSVLSLSVSDLQTGFLYSWSGLDTDLSNLNLTIDNVKRIALTITDTLINESDPTSHILTFYPLLDSTSYLVPSTSLVPGRTYDSKLHIRLDNNTILRANVLDKLNSIAPAQPVVDYLPGDNHVVLKFVGIVTANHGSSPIERIYVDVYNPTNNKTKKSLAIETSDPALDKTQEGFPNDWFYDITELDNGVQYECQVRYENATKESVDLDMHITPSEVPSAPQGVNVKPYASGELQVKWSRPLDSYGSYGYDVAQYWVYRKGPSDADYEYVGYTSNDIRELIDSGLTNGETYSYKVRAVVIAREGINEQDIIAPLTDGLNVGEFSDDVSSLCFDTTIDAPAFTVSSGDGIITVTLSQPEQNTGRPTNTNDVFVINYGGQTTTLNTQAGTNNTVEKVITGLTNYTVYDIKVRYVQHYANSDGGLGSNWSDSYVGNWSGVTVAMPIGPIPDPQNLTSSPHLNLVPVSTQTEGKLLLTWAQPGVGVSLKYRIYNEDGTVLVNNMNTSNVNNYTVGNLVLGSKYKFGVQSYYYYAEQDTEFSSDIVYVGKDATTQPFYYPSNAANLELEASDSTIIASWDDSANVNGGTNLRYEVKLYAGDELVQTFDNISDLSKEITGLTNGVTYTVVLSSYHTYDGTKFYSSSAGDVEDFLDQSASRTPYSAVPSVTGLVSSPVNTDDNKSPLSQGDNGVLQLYWDNIEYDKVGSNNGVFTGDLRYRVIVNGSVVVENLQTNSYLINTGLVLGEQYTVDVQAYYFNSEEEVEKSSDVTTVGPDATTQPFDYPTNGSNLNVQAGDSMLTIDWNANANAKGGHDLRYNVVVSLLGTNVSVVDNLLEGPVDVTGLTNGATYAIFVSSYTTYLGERYYSNEGGYFDLSIGRTPYSVPSAPSNFSSNPLNPSNNPLSSKTNGRLNLTWTPLSYDRVNGLPGRWTNLIRYRILDEDDNVLGMYTNLGVAMNAILVQNLTLGEARGLKIQAYFFNSEYDEFVYGTISSALSYDNIPFCNPDDVSSLLSEPSNGSISWSWTAGNGRGLTPKFEVTLDENSSELDQSSPKVFNGLTNGELHKLNVKTYTEYTPFGASQALKFYATGINNVVTLGVDKLEIARTAASEVQNLKAYPQADKFAATFDAPVTLGGAEFDQNDDFYLSGYRYTIKNLETQGNVVTAAFVSKESELIVREPLTSGKRYELKVWAVTSLVGPDGVTTENEISGDETILEFSYFVSGSTVAPDVHDLVITPGDSQLEVTFGFENSSDPNTQYEIIIYEVDEYGNLTDLNRILGPNSESAPVDGVVSETLTNLTNNHKYKVIVLVSSLDNSANRVYDSESKFGTPTADVPSGVQELVATNGDDGETTLTWSAPSVGAPGNKTLYYQVVNKDEWNLLDSGIVNDDKVNLTGEVISAVNDVVYTAMVRPYYIDNDGNRVYGQFKTVQALPLPEPEKVTLNTAVPGDKEVVLSWNNVSASDNIIYPKTELEILVKVVWPVAGAFAHLKTIYAVNGEIPVSTYTHNEIDDSDIENGKIYEYKLTLKNNKSVVANDSDAENVNDQLVPSSYNSSVDFCNDSDVAESTRPFDKPIVTVLPLSYNGNTTNFTMEISHNGRYVREILVVGVPTNDSLARDQDIMVVQKHFNFNSATNVLASASNALVENVSFPYTVKSILYIVENQDGNTVGTYPTLGL